jgi:hypothetical protein
MYEADECFDKLASARKRKIHLDEEQHQREMDRAREEIRITQAYGSARDRIQKSDLSDLASPKLERISRPTPILQLQFTSETPSRPSATRPVSRVAVGAR